MAEQNFDLIILGAGPGGYVAAIRASQLGLRVACVEKEKALGGTCLRIGCIPSKALLESSHRYWQASHELAGHGINCPEVDLDLTAMLRRKDEVVTTLTKGIDGLFKKNKISRFQGHGSFTGPQTVQVQGSTPAELRAPHIIIATGSVPASLRGIQLDHDRIGTSTEALAYPTVPSHLVVIGAGYIGLELGSVWQRLGAEVTVLEYLERILPGSDSELAADAQKVLAKQGLKFELGAKVTGARVEGARCFVESEGRKPVECDRVLVAVGRVPQTTNLGLEKVGVTPDAKGRIEVNDHFGTAAKGIYAIGDVIRGPMLAHKAEEEGVACVENIVTGRGHVDYNVIPGIVYTQPEIASVGKTEDELKQAGREFVKGSFPFRANGRALAMGEAEGKIKILADAKTDRVLGVHIIGPHAGDLINQAAMAMAFHASSEDLARTCQAHPTVGEALREAALAVAKRAIHY